MPKDSKAVVLCINCKHNHHTKCARHEAVKFDYVTGKDYIVHHDVTCNVEREGRPWFGRRCGYSGYYFEAKF